jgi:hypothetical protein
MRRSGSLGDERGNILIVTVLILFGVSVIGAAVATLSSMDLKISANRYAHTQALYVAEAGLSEAIHRISLPNPTQVTVGGWMGNAAISDQEPYDPDWRVRVYLTGPGSSPAVGHDVTTGTLQNPDAEYLEYSTVEDSDDVLTIEHKWHDRDGDGIREADEIVRWDPGRIPSENFSTGHPIEVITVTGTKANARRTLRAEVTPAVADALIATSGTSVPAAVYGDAGLHILRNFGICGYDHDAAIPPGLTPPVCAQFHTGAGHVPGVAGSGRGQIRLSPDGHISGFPAPTDNQPKPWRDPWQVLNVSEARFERMLRDADHTSLESDMNGVSYFRGNCVVNRPVNGSGLLYVEGSLDIRSDFRWTGLIYAGGKVTVTSDHCWVVGGIAGRDEIVWKSENSAGEQGVLYSAEAFRTIPRGVRPKKSGGGKLLVLSWREL